MPGDLLPDESGLPDAALSEARRLTPRSRAALAALGRRAFPFGWAVAATGETERGTREVLSERQETHGLLSHRAGATVTGSTGLRADARSRRRGEPAIACSMAAAD